MPMVDKTCEKCGTQFRAHSSKTGKFCSTACYHAVKGTLPKTFVCKKCGKECENKKGKDAKYCSRECFETAPKETDLKRRECPCCKVEFAPRWDTQVFCSRDCGYKNRRDPNRHTHCQHCGKELKRDVAAGVRFCSMRCVRLAEPVLERKTHTVGDLASAPSGYVRIKLSPGYPGADKADWMLLHRYVMQEHKRKTDPNFVLLRTHQVHHKDGDRKNNAIENLELTVVRGKGDLKHVPGQRLEDLVPGLVRAAFPQVLAYLLDNHAAALAQAVADRVRSGNYEEFTTILKAIADKIEPRPGK